MPNAVLAFSPRQLQDCFPPGPYTISCRVGLLTPDGRRFLVALCRFSLDGWTARFDGSGALADDNFHEWFRAYSTACAEWLAPAGVCEFELRNFPVRDRDGTVYPHSCLWPCKRARAKNGVGFTIACDWIDGSDASLAIFEHISVLELTTAEVALQANAQNLLRAVRLCRIEKVDLKMRGRLAWIPVVQVLSAFHGDFVGILRVVTLTWSGTETETHICVTFASSENLPVETLRVEGCSDRRGEAKNHLSKVFKTTKFEFI